MGAGTLALSALEGCTGLCWDVLACCLRGACSAHGKASSFLCSFLTVPSSVTVQRIPFVDPTFSSSACSASSSLKRMMIENRD